MLFTWDTTNLCIVFSSWRITSFWSLILSLVAVMALTAGYEAVREASRRYEARQTSILQNAPSKCQHQSEINLIPLQGHCAYTLQGHISEHSSLLPPGTSIAAQEQRGQFVKAAFYGVQVFYSFFIM